MEIAASKLHRIKGCGHDRLEVIPSPELEVLPAVVNEELAGAHCGGDGYLNIETTDIVENLDIIAILDVPGGRIPGAHEHHGLPPLQPKEHLIINVNAVDAPSGMPSGKPQGVVSPSQGVFLGCRQGLP